jgi:hypothetical protein
MAGRWGRDVTRWAALDGKGGFSHVAARSQWLTMRISSLSLRSFATGQATAEEVKERQVRPGVVCLPQTPLRVAGSGSLGN